MSRQSNVQARITQVAETLMRRGVANEDEIRGCTVDEIHEIESDTGLQLPEAYREFLSQMGRGAGRFYQGTDLFYPTILGMTRDARSLCHEDRNGIELPAGAVVWSMHQGYQFLFVLADEGEDPSVYHYMEQSGKFRKKCDSFTQFLLDVADDDW